jgi:hypothetical protein
MGPIRCPETSVNNYHTTPGNTREDRTFRCPTCFCTRFCRMLVLNKLHRWQQRTEQTASDVANEVLRDHKNSATWWDSLKDCCCIRNACDVASVCVCRETHTMTLQDCRAFCIWTSRNCVYLSLCNLLIILLIFLMYYSFVLTWIRVRSFYISIN